MTARRAPVGTRVKAWAERHCGAETLDTLILPAIADLQHEDSVSVGRPGIVRWAIRFRGYVGLGKALVCPSRESTRGVRESIRGRGIPCGDLPGEQGAAS